MRIYIAGPMTGRPRFNFPAFDREAELLREHGYEVITPAELDSPETRAAAMASDNGDLTDVEHTGTWGDFLARDVKLMADGGIDAVVVLPGWATSKGARLETFVAYLVGIPIYVACFGHGGVEFHEVPRVSLASAWAGLPLVVESRKVHSYAN